MTELNVYVAASSDDAEEPSAPSAPNLTSTDLDFYDGSSSWVLVRFLNVTVPAGSTINSAVVRFQSASTFGGTGHSQNIYCQDADDAPTATTDVGNISSRSLTSASAAWTPPATTQNNYYDTADFASALQEVINRPGWASGQAVVVLFRGSTTQTNRSEMYSYDSGGDPPQIRIDYTTPAAGITMPLASRDGVHSVVFGGQIVR